MLAPILPPGIHCVEGEILSDNWNVTPEESVLAESFGEKRKREFLTGRAYARLAVGRLLPAPEAGMEPILRDENRGPIWPSGIVGSISHTHRYCAAVVAMSSDFRAVGLDVETLGKVKDSIAEKICLNDEMRELAALTEDERARRLSLIFSAKEAFYKMQFPLTKAWVGFHDVRFRWESEGVHAVSLVKDVATGFENGQAFPGRHGFSDAHVAALTYLESYPK